MTKKNGKMLSKAQLLGELKLETEIVPLKTGNVLATEISAPVYASIVEKCKVEDKEGEKVDKFTISLNMEEFNPLLVVHSIVDEKGVPFFDEKDIPALVKSGAKTYSKLLSAAQRLNGLTGVEEKG